MSRRLPALAFAPTQLLPWPHLTSLTCDFSPAPLDEYSAMAVGLQLLAASPCAGQLRELNLGGFAPTTWATCPADLAAAFSQLEALHVLVLSSQQEAARVAELTTLTSLHAIVTNEPMFPAFDPPLPEVRDTA